MRARCHASATALPRADRFRHFNREHVGAGGRARRSRARRQRIRSGRCGVEPGGFVARKSVFDSEGCETMDDLTPVWWDGDAIGYVDQRLLPRELVRKRARAIDEVVE